MNSGQKSHLKLEWESWEHLVRQDIKRLDDRLQFVHQQMAVFSINREERDAFLVGKLVELIQEVTAREEIA